MYFIRNNLTKKNKTTSSKVFFFSYRSAASPGESGHVVGLLLGCFDETQELQLWHGANETGAEGQVQEWNLGAGLN